MKNIGIIAEYNPFHNGHQYQIQKAKALFPDKKILVIMSGDFVQRGEPAIFNKYIRAKCALYSGADIVFELPCIFATASAEHFACASVLSLAATGVVDTLCFGAENDNYSLFIQIADLLISEPYNYQNLLRKHLKEGLSYPKARAYAVAEYLQNKDCETLLRQPNNILGMEYIKAIRKYQLNMEPCIIKRQGGGYHDLSLENPFGSATALRNLINGHSTRVSTNIKAFPHYNSLPAKISDYMPEDSFNLLIGSKYAKPLFLSDFYSFLQYALWQQNSDYTKYFEVSNEISNSLLRLSQYPSDIEELISSLSSKNYTNTRIRRALLNILLKNTKEDMAKAKAAGYISYLRILGFRSPTSYVLRKIKDYGKLPLINKVADADKILSSESYRYFQKDIHISTLYKQVFSNKYGLILPSEYEQSVIIENL